MGAAITVELVASPPASDEAAQALIASCSGATPAGCTFADASRAADDRARVVVEFADGYARVRVRATLAPSAFTQGAPRSATREAQFRAEDPLVERFRATGLIAAGLVSDLTPERARPPEPPAPPPLPAWPPAIVQPAAVALAAPAVSSVAQDWIAALSFAGFVGISSVRPRLGFALAADTALRPLAVFLTTSASYEQAIGRDTVGISDARGRLGAGLGASAPVGGSGLSLVGRARVEVEDLQVSVSQPQTGRYDAATRILPGLAGEAEVAWSVTPGVAVFADVRGAWVDAQIDVAVGGKPEAVISPWSAGVGLGLAVEIR
jgi:hypothetical protein